MKSDKATLLKVLEDLLETPLEEYDSSNKDTHPLKNASEENKDNEELVYAAVKQHGFPLEFASERLKDNKKNCTWSCIKM